MNKHSPLSTIYRQYQVSCKQVANWQIAAYFADLESEKQQLAKASVLADWSHIGKISIRGKDAKLAAAQIFPDIEEVIHLRGKSIDNILCLQLAIDEYLLLCMPGMQTQLLQKINDVPSIVIDKTGALGCFALQGSGKDKVWQRSSAVNMCKETFVSRMVMTTTVHKMRCTIYRNSDLDIIVHERILSQSLFEALLDVGKNVGLTPSGIDVIPVAF